MDLNDPLRSKVQGAKKDYYEKQQINYPIDNHGVVDEWKALVNVLSDQHLKDQKIERERKIQQQRQYMGELENVRIVREQMKKEQLEKEKMAEAVEIQLKAKEYEEFKQKKQEQESNLKSYLRDSYQSLASQHRMKKQSELDKERLEDQYRAMRAQQSLDDDRVKKQQQRQEFSQAQRDLIQFRDQMKEQEKQMDDQKREAYKKMCDDNEQKIQDRQDQYKQFFKVYDQNLGARQVYHDAVVGEQERAKTRRLQDWEQNSAKLYQQIASQKAQQNELKNLSLKNQCHDWLDLQLQWKEQDKKKIEFEKIQDRQLKDQQVSQLHQEEQIKKIEDKERQQMYSQALDYQKNIQALQKQNFGKMTYTEKRINRDDLVHFKEHLDSYNALIPGLNNLKSVGAAPFKRTKAREAEMPGKLKMTMSVGDLQSPLLGQSKTDFNMNNTLARDQAMSSLGNSVDFRNANDGLISNIVSDANIEHHPRKEKIYSKRFIVDQSQYNTITNPIPNYNRNPYLNQVVSRAQLLSQNHNHLVDLRKSNVLSQAAFTQLQL